MERKTELIYSKIREAIIEIIRRATTQAPKDLVNALEVIKGQEKIELAIEQYDLMLENCKYGAEKGIPICQDTGVLNFFIELGSDFPIISDFEDIIKEAVSTATKLIPIRGNSVDPFTNENPENNLGPNYPPIYMRIINDSSKLKITVLPKGGGAENISKLFMLTPANGLERMQKEIIETIKEAGGMPCPPVILGIGIGGDATTCMNLAKKSLLRPLNNRNPRKEIAEIEENLIKKINQLNIGVMGLGGNISCIDVHIEYAMRHPASFPVGLIVQCYSHRIASFAMNNTGEIIYET
ncbi:MAG: fumarate hydratase [Promethearchaeota archaeon]